MIVLFGRGSRRSNAQQSSTALRFPSNVSGSDQAAPYAVIQFANPHTDGLPLWGPSGNGVTVFRRIRTFQQTGYYAQFWYTDDSSFESSFGAGNGYWGFHPYPSTGTSAGTTHYWEIAGDQGDAVNNGNASPITVVHNTWHTQALKVVRTNANSKTLTFYTNLPSVDAADVITVTITTANYGENTPPQPQPMLTIGDSPWFGTYQHERASCDIAEQMIIATAMSEADIVTQGNNMQSLATTASQNGIWWGKNTYSSVDDLTCDYGTGRSFVRNDTSNLIEVVNL